MGGKLQKGVTGGDKTARRRVDRPSRRWKKNRGGREAEAESERTGKEGFGRVEDDRGGLQTSVGRHLGNDNALTATANKSKGGRRTRRGRDQCALKSTPTWTQTNMLT